MNHLNNRLSIGVSLLVVLHECRTFVALYGLLNNSTIGLKTAIIVTTSSLLWISLLAIPIIQAIRLTNACKRLSKIGHEMSTQTNFDLVFNLDTVPDSFILFISKIKLNAKMFSIPIRVSYIMTILVLIVSILIFFGQINILNF
jgi:hypothetical protein